MPLGVNGQTYPGPDIARSWIKANMIGAVINAIAGFVLFVVGRALGVQEPDIGIALAVVFSVICIGGITFAMAVFGVLIGVVLRQKLRALPIRSWVGLYIVFGVVLGGYSAYALMLPDKPTVEPLENELFGGVVMGAAFAGALLGALSGSLQALLLGQAARGLGPWIGYSALAGTTLAMLMPVALFGPQDILLNEIMVEAASLAATVAAAVIMLPAVLGLEPR
jgi:hypothetical protein